MDSMQQRGKAEWKKKKKKEYKKLIELPFESERKTPEFSIYSTPTMVGIVLLFIHNNYN